MSFREIPTVFRALERRRIDPDVFVSRFDNLGNQSWIRQFGSAAVAEDYGMGVAADATGIYVVGWTLGALPGQTNLGNADAFVRKYDLNGNELWTRQFGTSAPDAAGGVTTDATGIYVVGYTTGALPGCKS